MKSSNTIKFAISCLIVLLTINLFLGLNSIRGIDRVEIVGDKKQVIYSNNLHNEATKIVDTKGVLKFASKIYISSTLPTTYNKNQKLLLDKEVKISEEAQSGYYKRFAKTILQWDQGTDRVELERMAKIAKVYARMNDRLGLKRENKEEYINKHKYELQKSDAFLKKIEQTKDYIYDIYGIACPQKKNDYSTLFKTIDGVYNVLAGRTNERANNGMDIILKHKYIRSFQCTIIDKLEDIINKYNLFNENQDYTEKQKLIDSIVKLMSIMSLNPDDNDTFDHMKMINYHNIIKYLKMNKDTYKEIEDKYHEIKVNHEEYKQYLYTDTSTDVSKEYLPTTSASLLEGFVGYISKLLTVPAIELSRGLGSSVSHFFLSMLNVISQTFISIWTNNGWMQILFYILAGIIMWNAWNKISLLLEPYFSLAVTSVTGISGNCLSVISTMLSNNNNEQGITEISPINSLISNEQGIPPISSPTLNETKKDN